MRLGIIGGLAVVLAVLLVIIGWSSLFVVHQTQQALVIRLGEAVRVILQPGLNLKVPVIDTVIPIDKRILDLELPAYEIIASDRQRLLVDAFARYRIEDPLRFYQSVNSIEGGNVRMSALLQSALRRVLGEVTFIHVVKEERPQLMARMRDQLAAEAAAFGINVVDVRIRRADLPKENSEAVYNRMNTERQRIAAETRAQGSQKAQEITARADRDVTVLLADAESKAQQIRGEGDAKRNQIFADAYSKDVDFFGFYRSMQAYEAGLRANDTRLLLKPDSDFFRYFADPSGKPRDNGKK
ncbi:MAG TPA: protease modulator HflC [Xanthobacteraceae bacterium]|nr:protease modulator HflC [Xanthobacteraceae bacterium]